MRRGPVSRDKPSSKKISLLAKFKKKESNEKGADELIDIEGNVKPAEKREKAPRLSTRRQIVRVINYLGDLPVNANPFRKTLFFSSEKTCLYLAYVSSVSASAFTYRLMINFLREYPLLSPDTLIDLGWVIGFLVMSLGFISKIYALGMHYLNEEQKAWLVMFCNETKEPLPNLNYMTKKDLSSYIKKAYTFNDLNKEKYKNYMFVTYL